MSQQKPGIKSDKAKRLREVRRRLEWTQQQMADALGLDASYLSQLENGHRNLDDWYLKKAGELEKNQTAPEPRSSRPSAEACVAYLRQFLATCKEPAKIVWTYVELQEHFPLDKWATLEQGVSSKLPFGAASLAPKSAPPYGRERPKP